jgi:hypothetical protein
MACLKLTAVNDGGLLGVGDGTGLGTGSLKSLDNLERLVIRQLAKDDMATIEPRSLDRGDEELGAVAIGALVTCYTGSRSASLRVGAGIGHGQKARTGVTELEVLIGKLLAVDGLATSALQQRMSLSA